MQLHDFYTSRINIFTENFNRLQKKENQLSAGRLIVFITSLVLFYIFFSLSVVWAIVLLVAGLFSLGWLIKFQNGVIRQKEHFGHLVEINKLELQSLDGNFLSFPDGSEFAEREHPYSYDLDIFGRASLFQYLNRTVTQPASQLLADWLKAPAPVDEILLRQEAVSELKDLADWRQNLMLVGYEYKNAANHPDAVLHWIDGPELFLGKKYLKPLLIFLSTITLLAAGVAIIGYSSSLLVILMLLNMWVYYWFVKSINKLHQQVGRSYDMLISYSNAINLIEHQNFKSRKLSSLVNRLKGNKPASTLIKKLSVLVNRLDMRLNLLVSMPLNIFFFWDIHYSIALEKWKHSNRQCISDWFSVMAEVEVLSSLANGHFNNPNWIVPTVTDEYFTLQAENMGHPLIPANRRVSNDFNINGEGKIILVTGSNMSGKSTFQRTCGINMILAFAGAPVCASVFKVSRVILLTSMRISDSLEDNTSSFYAELKRLAMIIKESEINQQVFLLLDEILRGTNSNDRHIGSEALIKQLIQQKVTGIVATHDISLSALGEEQPNHIENYNFDVKINGDELYFDYKLNHGICKSLNASILMKKMGIRV